MSLSPRQKNIIILLALYWPAIFILSHIPIPKVVYQAQVSDKVLHILVYLILVFLAWFAVSPDGKVNWRRAPAWWVLFTMVVYGIVDEWLQTFVGRYGDPMDFLADIAGVLAGLIVLSVFTFWPAALVVTAAVIFMLTNLARTNPAELLPLTNALFHLLSYALFTALWVRICGNLLANRQAKLKWLLTILSLPAGLLITVKLSAVLLNRHFGLQNFVLASAGIIIVVNASFIINLVRGNLPTHSKPAD